MEELEDSPMASRRSGATSRGESRGDMAGESAGERSVRSVSCREDPSAESKVPLIRSKIRRLGTLGSSPRESAEAVVTVAARVVTAAPVAAARASRAATSAARAAPSSS